LRRDLAYLTKQAANVSQLKQIAKETGSQLDKHLEILEWREFVDDAARFIIAAQAEGSKEFSKGAERIRKSLRLLGLTDAEFERLLSEFAQSQEAEQVQ
jgi:SOS response regulatory protein OraA/RecX